MFLKTISVFCSKMSGWGWNSLIDSQCDYSTPYLTFWSSGSRTCRWGSLHSISRNFRDHHLYKLSDQDGIRVEFETPRHQIHLESFSARAR